MYAYNNTGNGQPTYISPPKQMRTKKSLTHNIGADFLDQQWNLLIFRGLVMNKDRITIVLPIVYSFASDTYRFLTILFSNRKQDKCSCSKNLQDLMDETNSGYLFKIIRKFLQTPFNIDNISYDRPNSCGDIFAVLAGPFAREKLYTWGNVTLDKIHITYRKHSLTDQKVILPTPNNAKLR